MLKINLLPPSIHQGRQMKIAIGVVTLLVAAEVAGLVMFTFPLQARLRDLNDKKQREDELHTQLQSLSSEAQTVNGQTQALRPKLDFINGMLEYNKQYPSLYRRTAGYTYREVTFLDLSAGANSLQFNAYVSNASDVSRLMLGLTNSPDFLDLPQITGVPSYSEIGRAHV